MEEKKSTPKKMGSIMGMVTAGVIEASIISIIIALTAKFILWLF